MRKRYYIMLVMRDGEGELRKIPIPLHYLYVFIAGAVIGMLTVTGMVGSYTRMLFKVARFNQLRTEKEALSKRYNRLEQVARQQEIQVASLGSLASEVSALYGLRTDTVLEEAASAEFSREQFYSSITHLYTLKDTALSGGAAAAIAFGRASLTTSDWLRLAATPSLWPVEGHISSSFGQRIDPLNGEGAFHRGVDISSTFGSSVVSPADGIVTFAGYSGGYGRVVVIDHGHGITTRLGHLSSYVVAPGQQVHRGQRVGFVGDSGRATGYHVHYEVRINDVPVNPYKYLRTTLAQAGLDGHES